MKLLRKMVWHSLIVSSSAFCGKDEAAALRQFFLKERFNPHVKAFLDVIAYAEGTEGPEGYHTQFTYQYFEDFSDHPRQVFSAWYRGQELRSSAAGRYQFLARTWDYVKPRIEATDFSPLNQDVGALVLIHEKGALALIKEGRFDEAIGKVCTVWASLPGAPYGQPMKSLDELRSVYKKKLKIYKLRRL